MAQLCSALHCGRRAWRHTKCRMSQSWERPEYPMIHLEGTQLFSATRLPKSCPLWYYLQETIYRTCCKPMPTHLLGTFKQQHLQWPIIFSTSGLVVEAVVQEALEAGTTPLSRDFGMLHWGWPFPLPSGTAFTCCEDWAPCLWLGEEGGTTKATDVMGKSPSSKACGAKFKQHNTAEAESKTWIHSGMGNGKRTSNFDLGPVKVMSQAFLFLLHTFFCNELSNVIKIDFLFF